MSGIVSHLRILDLGIIPSRQQNINGFVYATSILSAQNAVE